MAGKIIVSVVSLIMVVGAVVGVIAAVHSGTSKEEDKMSASMKAVDTICQPTDHKDACVRSLSRIAQNESATDKDYLSAVLKATVDGINGALGVVSKTTVDNNTDPYNAMAVDDCRELLNYAIDMLQASISMVGDSDMHTIGDRVDQFLNWLGAVYACQSVCLDQLDKPQYKDPIANGMINATQLTENALVIMNDIPQLVNSAFTSLKNAAGGKNRRLLDIHDHKDGYPSWFSAADRKLLDAVGQGQVQPNAVVDQKAGPFRSINDAIKSIPNNFNGRFVIYVKAGIYHEPVVVDKPNVLMYGDGPAKTIIIGAKNSAIRHITTYRTGVLTIKAANFVGMNFEMRNTAGPEGHQACAMVSRGDKTAFFNCNFKGYQDTLYYVMFQQFYRDCAIYGTIDFIFGKGSAVIQNSLIIVRKGGPNQNQNTVTADGRDYKVGAKGLVLQNCRIVPDRVLFPERFKINTYLGRPWSPSAITAIIETEIGDLVRPEGYLAWSGSENTAEYYEYKNRGPGADISKRVNWPKLQFLNNPKDAARFTAGQFIGIDNWPTLKNNQIPFASGFMT